MFDYNSGCFFLTNFGDFLLTRNGYNRLTLTVRLINNCIKHNDSKVSDDLSRKFPGEYTKNDEIDINPELVYELLEITVNAIRKFNKLFNQYYHD
ncbi:MAG: hypothetical protein MR852_06885 [Treponema sp.]|mgnify:FL=1|uniref:hypothetical protein n=1 Tax=Treponema sp. TaxID=166 RepID=UPI00298EA6B5|nr:hypothetical protein [Treponema sp.]MCI6891738.1 hypothetical protein [Treponema sp.]